jgi:hypothetical protein
VWAKKGLFDPLMIPRATSLLYSLQISSFFASPEKKGGEVLKMAKFLKKKPAWQQLKGLVRYYNTIDITNQKICCYTLYSRLKMGLG